MHRKAYGKAPFKNIAETPTKMGNISRNPPSRNRFLLTKESVKLA